ncbi:hypothetical protein [Polyangium aurulentum]|uniref:hypothetical protein n=1 Tax=Polyangium aurulentum TaxID=2567896 RepID=UPI0010AEAD63|nr:hypothetical protein [Polyangium aurulentum]UQA63468.1 hypothetical protein E8A73_024530 [Polyangium aurulentum]
MAVTAVPYETQLDARHRRLDRALDANVDGERRILHFEWQGDLPPEVSFRVYEYNAFLALAVAAEAGGRKGPVPRIDSVVVLLGGREEPWPDYGSYRTSSEDAPFSGVHYRIEAVYQRTVAELEARGSPFWLVFVPLAVDADRPKIRRVVEALRTQASSRAFDELGVAMAVLAEADRRRRGLADVVRSLLPRELVMQSSIYKEGKEQGRFEGQLEQLAHLFERRLARALTPEEHATLVERVQEQGAMPVSDVVLDLSREDLAAWLTTKNGH